MKNTKIIKRLSAVLTVIVCLQGIVGVADAALRSRYEQKIGDIPGASVPVTIAPAAPVPPPAAPAQALAPAPQSPQKNGELVASCGIPAIYVKAMAKEHENFREAFIRAELSLRYYIRKGKERQEPSSQQLKNLRFQITQNLKALESSANRYSRNIRYAKLAMLQMDEQERSIFAEALASLYGTPAWASSQGVPMSANLAPMDVMNRLENTMTNVGVASGTAQLAIDQRSLVETTGAWEAFKSSYGAQVLASGAKLGATVAGTIGGAALGVIAIGSLPVTATGAAIVGVAGLGVGILGGTISIIGATDDFVKAVKDDTSSGIDAGERERLENLGNAVSAVNITVGLPGLAQSSSTAEFVQGGLSSVSDAMGFWGEEENRNDEKANEINRELDSVMKEGGSGGGNDSGGGSGGGCSGSF